MSIPGRGTHVEILTEVPSGTDAEISNQETEGTKERPAQHKRKLKYRPRWSWAAEHSGRRRMMEELHHRRTNLRMTGSERADEHDNKYFKRNLNF